MARALFCGVLWLTACVCCTRSTSLMERVLLGLMSSGKPKRRRHAVPHATLHLDGQRSAPPDQRHLCRSKLISSDATARQLGSPVAACSSESSAAARPVA